MWRVDIVPPGSSKRLDIVAGMRKERLGMWVATPKTQTDIDSAERGKGCPTCHCSPESRQTLSCPLQ